jgi:apolipoprotein N-acyltransferase
LLLVVLGGSIRLTFFAPSAQTVRVAGVNAAQATYERAQNLEGDPDQAPVRAAFTATNNELFDASRREALAGAKIIVWPEQGGLTFDRDEAKLLASGQTLAREEHIYLEMAYEVFQPVPSQNKAVLIDPQGRVVWTQIHHGSLLAHLSPG